MSKMKWHKALKDAQMKKEDFNKESGKELRQQPPMGRLGPNYNSGRSSQLRAGGNRADSVLKDFGQKSK